jgi:hypothetical protein
MRQAAENGPQLRSRVGRILTVAQGYASGLASPAALLDGRFEQPDVIPSSATSIFRLMINETS